MLMMRSETAPVSRWSVSRVRGLVLVALACFGAAWVGIELTRAAGRVAAIWPGNAVLVAVLLCIPPRMWASYLAVGFVANLAANLVSGDVLGSALLLGVANSLEVILAVGFMRKRVGKAPDFTRSGTLANFVLAAAGASVVSASIASFVLGDISVWRTWFLADTLGLLLLTPMLVLIGKRSDPAPERPLSWECAAFPLTGVLVTAVAFSQHHLPLLFLIFPPLIAAAFRVGVRGAAAVTFLALAVAFAFTMSGNGPIAENMPDLPSRVLFLQFYAVIALLTALPVAAFLAERNRLAASLAASERRFRTLAEAAPAGIFRGDPSGAITYVNRAWTDLTGLSPDEAQGGGWLSIFPDEQREKIAETWQRSLQTGWSDVREVRYNRRSDGKERLGGRSRSRSSEVRLARPRGRSGSCSTSPRASRWSGS